MFVVAVRVSPDRSVVVHVGTSLPVLADLLKLLEGLVLPGIVGLPHSPVGVAPLVAFVVNEVEAGLTSESSVLVLARAVSQHIEVVLVVTRDTGHEDGEADDSGLVRQGLLFASHLELARLHCEFLHHRHHD